MATDYKSMFQPYAVLAAQKSGIPADIFTRLIESESSWNPNAQGPVLPNGTRASGIAQFLPGTAKEYGIDPLNASQAIFASADYLAKQYKRFGDWGMAVAQYKGYKDIEAGAQTDIVRKVVDGLGAGPESETLKKVVNTETAKPAQTSAEVKPYRTKSIWQWTGTDWGDFFFASFAGLSILALGALIVLFSLYALIVRGTTKVASSLPELKPLTRG